MTTLKRIFLSVGFWGACFGLTVMEQINLLQELSLIDLGDTTVLYLYEIGTYSNFWILYLLFAAIPSATLFCSDWENRYIRSLILRSAKLCYAVSNAIACYLTAFLVVLIGDTVFILLLHLQYPWYSAQDMQGLGIDSSIYRTLTNGAGIYVYFLIRTVCKACCAAFTSVFALWLSTIIPNIFMTLASPVIAFYLIENMLAFFQLPAYFQIGSLAKGSVTVGGLASTILYIVVLFSLFAAIFGCLFVCAVKRRVENG